MPMREPTNLSFFPYRLLECLFGIQAKTHTCECYRWASMFDWHGINENIYATKYVKSAKIRPLLRELRSLQTATAFSASWRLWWNFVNGQFSSRTCARMGLANVTHIYIRKRAYE